MTGKPLTAPASLSCDLRAPLRDSAPDLRVLFASAGVVLAPMAGITDMPFRAVCRAHGARVTYTEMISAVGLHHHAESRVANELLTFAPGEYPCGLQLFGSDPELMAEQAAALTLRCAEHLAFIDINMGCPVTKVVRKGEGSGMMLDPEGAARVVAAVVSATHLPVTAKFRIGWDEESRDAADFARRMEAAGASAVAVHGRTREQFYRGPADWKAIAQVVDAVGIPVVGSGDIFSASDVLRMRSETGVAAVMIARGALGNPWIFEQAHALLDEPDATIVSPTLSERIEQIRAHARLLADFTGAQRMAKMRKHVAWYVHGMPEATRVRSAVNSVMTLVEIEALLDEYLVFLRDNDAADLRLAHSGSREV